MTDRNAAHTTHLCPTRHPLVAAIAISLLAGLGAQGALAADSHWQGGTSGDWTLAANWDTAPTSGSQVIIDTTSPHATVLGSAGHDIDVLIVGDQASGSLTLSGGGTLATHGIDILGNGLLLANAAGSTGRVTVSGAGSTLTVDQQSQIGGGGAGTLSVVAGGTANLGLTTDDVETVVGFSFYGQGTDAASGSGTVRVDGSGSTLHYAGGLNLLNGSLTVSDGGTLASQSRGDGGWEDIIGYGQVANTPGSVVSATALDGRGTAVIRGAGSSWQSVNMLSVGRGAQGSLSILDGASAGFQGTVQIGVLQPTYDYVADPSTGQTTSTLIGIKQGDGSVTVSGVGSTLRVAAGPSALGTGPGDLVVGAGSQGELDVDDAGQVDVAGMLTVGDQTTGTTTISGGGTLAVHGADDNGIGAILATSDGSLGNLTVAGTDSTLDIDAGFEVGYGGTGALTVQQGATANLGLVTARSETVVGLGYYGNDVLNVLHGTGSIVVVGNGSTLNYAGGLNILDGNLQVDQGAHLIGQVRAADPDTAFEDVIGYGLPADADIGYPGIDGQAQATVEGAGSTWDSTHALHIGVGGTGSVSILDGGTARFLGQVYLGDAGQLYNYGQPTGLTRAGAGSLTVSGNGSSLTVAAAAQSSTYGAGTLVVGYVGAGSLVVKDAGHIDVASTLTVGDQASGTVAVSGGGMLAVHGADDSGFGAVLGHVDGSQGTLTVAGAGSALAVDAGVHIGDAGQAALSILDGGSLQADGGIEIGAHGSMTIGGLDTHGEPSAPGTVDTPTLKLDASQQAFSLVFRHSATENGEYIFAPKISGNGGIGVESGFTKLTGDSSGFTGHTQVSAGATLSVNGQLGGDIDVLPGGRLQGTGTIDNAVIGGTLAPGNSPGTLHVNGDLVLQSGSVYEAQIDPATGQSDSVEVGGNVTIEPGTTLDIQSLGDQPLIPGATIKLIQSTADGTVSGQFDNTSGALDDFLGYGVHYAADGSIEVGVTRSSTSFASIGDTAQTRALGAALDGVPADSALGLLLFGQLTTADQAASALRGMAGTLHADLRRTMLDDSRLPRNAIEQRLQEAGSAEGAAWWVRGFGSWGHVDGADGLAGARSDSSGILVGFDTDVGGTTRLGVAGGFGQTAYREPGRDASAHIKTRHLALYGRSRQGRLGIGYGVAFSWNDIGTNRAFTVGDAPQQLNSDRHARTGQVFLDVGYRLGDDAHRYLEPYVAVAHVRLHDDAAHEGGSATALDVRSGSDDATFGTLGLRGSVAVGAVHWTGALGWRHVFGGGRPQARAAFAAGGSTFQIQGLPMARNAARIELGAGFDIGRRTHVTFGYDGLVAGSSTEHGARAQLTVDL